MNESGPFTMSADSQLPSLYHLTETLSEDLAKLRSMAQQFASGELAEAQFKAFRVPLGVYEQRESGTYMLRVRLPAGAVLPEQMRVLAQVSRQFGNGILHFTTRQDIQVHNVPLEGIADGLVALQAAGMSSKGGGGNTVRTITSCADTGVCAHGAFDVAPHVVALTEFLQPDPLSYQLPRKYKLAVSGCGRDCAGAAVNDLGLIASVREGVAGFTVYAAGGMGAHSAVGQVLEDFIPTQDACYVAEAVKRVFDQHGNRKNRNRARIRFLVQDIGFEAFKSLYRQELAKLRQAPPSLPELRPFPQPNLAQPNLRQPMSAAAAAAPQDPQYLVWRGLNVSAQAQAGHNLVSVPLVLGDITAEALEGLAEIVAEYGEGLLRATQTQNALLRWVSDEQVPTVYQRLSELGLARTEAPLLANLVPCTGAATCKLGICLSRGLAEAIANRLQDSQLDLHSLGKLGINISGCPNSCGRHPIADIGFSGAARRVDGRLVPHYSVHLGGSIGSGEARLASPVGTIPARNVPAFLLDLLVQFAASGAADFTAFAVEQGDAIKALLSDHRHVPLFSEDRKYYYDWGSEELFSLAGRGAGECGAGVFELIEVDLASAKSAWEQGRYYVATALAARALLVTRGEQADSDKAALELFQKHFVSQNLVTPEQTVLVEEAVAAADTADPEKAFTEKSEVSGAFVAAVRNLYNSMDASLRPTCTINA